MRFSKIFSTCMVIMLVFCSIKCLAQNPENWTAKQLLEPADLAGKLNTGADSLVIISVGPGAIIPNSIDAGLAKEKEGLDKLKNQLSKVPKDTKVVVYCGCCPFNHCPNVRPAIDVLKELKFTNYFLLDLPHNIRTDWIDKGFPVKQVIR